MPPTIRALCLVLLTTSVAAALDPPPVKTLDLKRTREELTRRLAAARSRLESLEGEWLRTNPGPGQLDVKRGTSGLEVTVVIEGRVTHWRGQEVDLGLVVGSGQRRGLALDQRKDRGIVSVVDPRVTEPSKGKRTLTRSPDGRRLEGDGEVFERLWSLARDLAALEWELAQLPADGGRASLNVVPSTQVALAGDATLEARIVLTGPISVASAEVEVGILTPSRRLVGTLTRVAAGRLALAAGKARTWDLTVPLPAEPGTYYLCALLRTTGDAEPGRESLKDAAPIEVRTPGASGLELLLDVTDVRFDARLGAGQALAVVRLVNRSGQQVALQHETRGPVVIGVSVDAPLGSRTPVYCPVRLVLEPGATVTISRRLTWVGPGRELHVEARLATAGGGASPAVRVLDLPRP